MSTEYEPFGYSIEYYFEDQGLVARPRINFLDITSEYVRKCIDQENVIPLMLQDKKTLNRIVYEEFNKDENMFEGLTLNLTKKGRKNLVEPRFLEIDYTLNLPYFLSKNPTLRRPYYHLSADLRNFSESLDDDARDLAQTIALKIYDQLICDRNGEKGKSSPILSI